VHHPVPASVIVIVVVAIVVVVATPSATSCDEDQRARRYACETELEEVAAGYLFPAVHWHPPSYGFVDYVMIALLEGVSENTSNRQLRFRELNLAEIHFPA
jgi:hypothetical protein